MQEGDNPNLFNRAELNIRMVDYFDSISTMVVVMFAAGIVCAMVYERTRLHGDNCREMVASYYEEITFFL